MKKTISRILAVLMVLCLMATSLGILSYAEESKAVKNIIFMIGDGMGVNSIEWTKAEKQVRLAMDTFPIQGYSMTNSLTGTTDSAAGGTALSCGNRTYNGNVGEKAFAIGDVSCTFSTFMNSLEVAKSLGKKTGVVTSDVNSGATPASFTVHSTDRDNKEDITTKQLASGYDLIWAAANGLVNEENAAASGWAFIDDMAEIELLPEGTRSFGAFSGSMQVDDGSDTAAPISELTSLAIEKLDNDKGFFLMVEGAHIDKNSHNNEAEKMMNALIEFDKAVANAIEFAKEDGNTIVIVTADHETGAIKKNSDGSFEYTSGSHSNADVPLRVYGTDELIENGEAIKNCEISQFTAKAMGYEGEYPVAEFNKNFFIDFIKSLFEFLTGWMK